MRQVALVSRQTAAIWHSTLPSCTDSALPPKTLINIGHLYEVRDVVVAWRALVRAV